MSDKPLPWPYLAKEARDQSAEEAQAIVDLLSLLLDETNDPKVLRHAAHSLNAAQTILRLLEAQGAQTRAIGQARVIRGSAD